ncbi:MAG TPA: tetratricopeptide repeat protein, partial [Candidatus Solibacter sp.]|nr:tetratricopeptide repeat protein [Candidatus Solibacter sp.]
RNTDATAVLNTMLKEYPGDVEAITTRADLRMTTGKPDEMRAAISEFEDLLKEAPDNNRIRSSLANAYRQTGRDALARATLLDLVRRDPRNRRALEGLADLAIRSRRPDEALHFAENLLEIDPGNTRGRLIRTAAWALHGRYPEVRAELRRLTEEYPDLTEAWLQMGTLNLDEHRFAEAEQIYRRLYQNGAHDIRALRGLTAVYLAQGQAATALAVVREEAGRVNTLEVRTLLATTAVQAGDLNLALATALKLAADFPDKPEHLVFAADLQRETGQLDQALANYERARQIAPADPIALSHLANLLEQMGRIQEAIAASRSALNLQPDNVVLMNSLAWQLALGGANLDEAFSLASKAVRREPDNPALNDTLGMVYLKLRKFDEAARTLQTTLQKDPNNPVFRQHFGMALIGLGQRQRAKMEFEAAMRNRPAPPDAEQIRKLLDALQ